MTRSFSVHKLLIVVCITGFALFSNFYNNSAGAPTPEQKKELLEFKKEIAPIQNHIKKKEYDDADKKLTELEAKLNKLVKDAGFQETDPAVLSTRKLIDQQAGILMKQKNGGKAAQVSFKNDIAPIFNAGCISCHGDNNPRAGLKLNSFANMKKGGQSGQLLSIGKPQQSLLMARISVRGKTMMPKDGEMLKRAEIEKISNWIQQGAKYDDDNENLTFDELIKKTKEAKLPPVTVVKADGTEKMSFTKDVAPMLVNVCSGCHNDRRKDGGLSLSTFENLLRGGESGSVLLAGEPEKSRMYRLVMQIEMPKMPQGQALIKRSQAVALGDWIKEGLKFDGKDPKAPLRELVPTETEIEAQKFASMSNEDLFKLRNEQVDAIWKKASSGTPVKLVKNQFLIIGDVPEIRLNQVAEWAEKTLMKMQSSFNDKSTTVWKGKLAIMVFKDRFGYQEFNLTIEQRDAPRTLHSHTKVTENFQQAYVVLEDVGDTTNAERSDLRFGVVQQVAAAYMLAQSTKLPGWLVEGSGMYIAMQEVESVEFSKALNGQAKAAFESLNQPQLVFRPGSLSPGDVGPAGMAIVNAIMSTGKPQQFKTLVQEFSSGSQADAAIQKAYNINAKTLAEQVATQLTGTVTPGKGKKTP